MVAVLVTGAQGNADVVDDTYLHCTYDAATGTAHVELLTNFEYVGGPLNYYIPAELESAACDAPGPVERVVTTAGVDGFQMLTLTVPGGFIGGTPEPDGHSEIEMQVDLGPAPNAFSLWTARGGGEGSNYFVITASGEVDWTGDGDADITVADGSVSRWHVTSGPGNDFVRSALEAGSALQVSAGRDDDDVKLGASTDSVYGMAGNDTLVTDSGDDVIHGDGGRDLIRAGAGNDQVTGGWGRDTVYGGKGDDQFWVLDGTKDFVTCGPGFDTVMSSSPGDVLGSDCEVVIAS
jgi:Ca2+-binding RTX toxin-like protein